MGHCVFIVFLFMDAQVIIFYWLGYLFCTFVNNYVVLQLLCHRGHMCRQVRRKFHKDSSLNILMKESLQCQKLKEKKKNRSFIAPR